MFNKFLEKCKTVINCVGMINAETPGHAAAAAAHARLPCPRGALLLNVCAYFSWPLILELQPAAMQDMKHFRLQNAD